MRNSRPRLFYFQPADIITQILNFGLPAPIDVQVVGNDAENNRRVALAICCRRSSGVRGAVDVHLHQIVDSPSFFVNVDRVRAAADRARPSSRSPMT